MQSLAADQGLPGWMGMQFCWPALSSIQAVAPRPGLHQVGGVTSESSRRWYSEYPWTRWAWIEDFPKWLLFQPPAGGQDHSPSQGWQVKAACRLGDILRKDWSASPFQQVQVASQP